MMKENGFTEVFVARQFHMAFCDEGKYKTISLYLFLSEVKLYESCTRRLSSISAIFRTIEFRKYRSAAILKDRLQSNSRVLKLD